MTETPEPGFPVEAVEQYRDELVQLAESELPVAVYAERALECLGPGEGDE